MNAGQQAAAAAVPPASPGVIRKETFELVWRTVKEKHFDPLLNGVDWEAVHKTYEPRVEAAKDDAELYRHLTEMLEELKQSHFGILPPSGAFDDDAGGLAGKEGTVGLHVRMLGEEAVVDAVLAGSPAAQAGIRPGFTIIRIGNLAVKEIRKRVFEKRERPAMLNYEAATVVMRKLGGPTGTLVRIGYLDARNTLASAGLRRVKPEGELMRFGQLPPILGQFESKRLDGNIGYIRFNIFLVPMMEKIRVAVGSMSDVKGFIIDLRGNPGGLGIMAPGIARLFCKEQTSLGSMKMRKGEQNFVVFANPEAFQGPVVILLDGASASTSEVFAGGMQDIGRATIVGEASVGAVLPSVIEKLPTGARLQYAIADFKTPKGILLEGRGVIPDIPVAVTRQTLIAGRDPAMDRAIALIQSQRDNRTNP